MKDFVGVVTAEFAEESAEFAVALDDQVSAVNAVNAPIYNGELIVVFAFCGEFIFAVQLVDGVDVVNPDLRESSIPKQAKSGGNANP